MMNCNKKPKKGKPYPAGYGFLLWTYLNNLYCRLRLKLATKRRWINKMTQKASSLPIHCSDSYQNNRQPIYSSMIVDQVKQLKLIGFACLFVVNGYRHFSGIKFQAEFQKKWGAARF